MTDFSSIADAVIRGDAAAVDALVAAALREGESASALLEQGLTAGMAEVGRRFRANEIFVPEVLIAARSMKAGLAHLEPVFASAGVEPAGTCVLGTVRGDVHDIGKNLVGMMLRGAGFHVIDLGVNVAVEQFVAAVQEHRPQLVGLSALLTTTMLQMQPTIAAIKTAAPDARVIVGGAPVTAEFAKEIGADGYGATAPDGVETALRLLRELKA